MKNSHGFSLIEILVTVVIISTALLGLVGLQAAGIKSTTDSYNRTQASHLAYSMADRMRANRAEASKGSNSLYVTKKSTDANIKTNCSSNCTPAEMAENDLYEWNADLVSGSNGLSKTAEITFNDPVFTIALCLNDDIVNYSSDGKCPSSNNAKSPNPAHPELTFRTDFQL